MLLEQAVGDAYALAWEFCPGQRGANDLATYHGNPNYPEFPKASYSDDTIRALANAQVVLGDPGRWFDPLAYVAAYQAAHRSDPRLGWSKSFQAYLEANQSAAPRDFAAGLRRRATNGAVMGAATLGFLPHEGSVRMAAAAQTLSTHGGGAVASAQAVALAAHYLLRRKGPLGGLIAYLRDQVDWTGREEADRILGPVAAVPTPGMPAWTIAANALFMLVRTDLDGLSARLSGIVEHATTSSSDADSAAAVTLALASCSDEIRQDLPRALVDGLETASVREELVEADRRLHAFAGTSPVLGDAAGTGDLR